MRRVWGRILPAPSVNSFCCPQSILSVYWLIDASLRSHGYLLLPVSSYHSPCEHVGLCDQITPFNKDSSHIRLQPTQMTSLKLDHLCKDLISKQNMVSYSVILRIRTLTYLLWGHNSNHTSTPIFLVILLAKYRYRVPPSCKGGGKV